MLLRGYSLRYAALILFLLFFMTVSGLLIYLVWFSAPPEPPHRSRPVSGIVQQHSLLIT